MLGKLAYRNTKRNIKDYMIYLITVTASFSLIFAFNLVASSDEIVKLCSSMDAFKNSLFAVNILIVFVICFLINYTTKFMFEKRSKELGTYMLLGIEKKEIAHLVVIENILLGILAIVLAIPIGFLFSQFVSLVIVNLLGIPKTLFISLNFVSIGLLIIYFLTIYVLVLLNLLRRISKMTIRDFLYFDKQNEKKMFRDSKKRNVIFVLSIILGVISLFLWNSRCTMDNFNKQETLLLDINLPYENGYEVCRKIKQVMPVPIIFVTSRDTNADELKSIQVGGIDFITKPYDTLILLEKIKRALQLSNPNNFRELVKKDCTLDLHLSILKYQEQSIELTRNEFRILYYFFMNEDKVISKEELLEKLWNDKYYIDENVLLVNMTRLKKKMKEIGIVHLLENIRGKGWKL